MPELIERLRPLRAVGIALIVLVVSAGIVLAASGGTHGRGSSHAHGPTASEQPDESERPNQSGASGDAQGALVSAAARMATPDGFRNHGAFVSCVAHMKGASLATIQWSTITPASCAVTAPEGSEAP